MLPFGIKGIFIYLLNPSLYILAILFLLLNSQSKSSNFARRMAACNVSNLEFNPIKSISYLLFPLPCTRKLLILLAILSSLVIIAPPSP